MSKELVVGIITLFCTIIALIIAYLAYRKNLYDSCFSLDSQIESIIKKAEYINDFMFEVLRLPHYSYLAGDVASYDKFIFFNEDEMNYILKEKRKTDKYRFPEKIDWVLINILFEGIDMKKFDNFIIKYQVVMPPIKLESYVYIYHYIIHEIFINAIRGLDKIALFINRSISSMNYVINFLVKIISIAGLACIYLYQFIIIQSLLIASASIIVLSNCIMNGLKNEKMKLI
jgi:hypothetical protein